jgi:putative flippase GtrA
VDPPPSEGAEPPRSSGLRGTVERAADALVPRSLQGYREQLQYLGVGAWNTVFGYGVWALMEYALGPYLNYLVIVALSYPIAIANAYVWYRYVVFRSHGKVWKELPRFSVVYLLTMAANLLVLPFLMHVLPFSVYVTQAIFLVLTVIASYLAHRFFSFRGGQVPAGGPENSVGVGTDGRRGA